MNIDFVIQLNNFLKNYREVSYRKGDIIIRGDDVPSGVYFIKKGTVKMSFIANNGNELCVNILKPGAFFPMIWALGEMENTYFFQSLSDSSAVRVPREEFIEFLKKNPALLYDLTRRVLVGLDGLLFNVKHLLSGTSLSKISVVLYSLARRFGVKNGGKVDIGLTITHQELASFAGLSRETATLAINKLVKGGIVEQSRRRILIRDLEKLQDMFK